MPSRRWHLIHFAGKMTEKHFAERYQVDELFCFHYFLLCALFRYQIIFACDDKTLCFSFCVVPWTHTSFFCHVNWSCDKHATETWNFATSKTKGLHKSLTKLMITQNCGSFDGWRRVDLLVTTTSGTLRSSRSWKYHAAVVIITAYRITGSKNDFLATFQLFSLNLWLFSCSRRKKSFSLIIFPAFQFLIRTEKKSIKFTFR
jgi:hypothetical protein